MKWTTAKLVDKKVWTEGLFTLTVSAEVTPFLPGQYLHLAVVNGEDRINRPYSVASPHGSELEFFIVLVEDGQLTPKLWSMEVGAELEISQRGTGSFTLAKSPDAKNLWLISTGTGLAPYIAMLRENEAWERYEKIVVVHGVRHLNDFAYQEELAGYGEKYGDRFSYLQVLSREDAPGTLRGRIPQVMDSGQLEEAAGAEMSTESAVLLCGNPAMLDEMEEKLGKRDMTRHRTRTPGQIVMEKYW